MQPSPQLQIPVTITGSMPQDPATVAAIEAAARGQINQSEADQAAAEAIIRTVAWQASRGIRGISDGELGRLSFMEGGRFGFRAPPVPFIPADIAETGAAPWAPEYLSRNAQLVLPSNDGPVTYDPRPITTRIEQFRTALDLAGAPADNAFLAAPSPGTLALAGSSHYTDHRTFVTAIGEQLRREYRAITDAGLVVQIDDPGATIGFHAQYNGMPLPDYLTQIEFNRDVLNHALAGIPASQIRLHVCWGNYLAPHHRDIPLEDILSIVYGTHTGMLVLEVATPQHRGDWHVLAEHPPRPDLTIAAGVIDTTTPNVESPAAVADALIQIAESVGPDRVWAGPGCGFSTFSGAMNMSRATGYLKLDALVKGAKLASEQLSPGHSLVGGAAGTL